MPINAHLMVRRRGCVGEQLNVEMRPHFEGAAIAHVDRDIEDDREPDIGDPAVLVQEAAR